MVRNILFYLNLTYILFIPEINANADASISNSMPFLCPLESIVSDLHKSIIHGAGETIHWVLFIMSKRFKGCILVFEYCYFLSHTNSNAKHVLDIALREYQESGTQAIVSNVLQDAIKEHSNDHDTLMNVITDIILTNQMCKLSNLLV